MSELLKSLMIRSGDGPLEIEAKLEAMSCYKVLQYTMPSPRHVLLLDSYPESCALLHGLLNEENIVEVASHKMEHERMTWIELVDGSVYEVFFYNRFLGIPIVVSDI